MEFTLINFVNYLLGILLIFIPKGDPQNHILNHLECFISDTTLNCLIFLGNLHLLEKFSISIQIIYIFHFDFFNYVLLPFSFFSSPHRDTSFWYLCFLLISYSPCTSLIIWTVLFMVLFRNTHLSYSESSKPEAKDFVKIVWM